MAAFNKQLDRTVAAGANNALVTVDMQDSIGAAFACSYSNATPSAATVQAANINLGTDICTSNAAHNFVTGLLVRVTTATTLPTPLLVATDYYVIVLSTTTFKFATSVANALAGTAIDLGGAPVGDMTVTPTALAGNIVVQASNDNVVWFDVATLTQALTSGTQIMFQATNAFYGFARLIANHTAGQVAFSNITASTKHSA